jgi:hypothetical protein
MSLPDTPAFPKTGNFNNDPSGEYDSENQNGMSLRDYFAGQALSGLVGLGDDLEDARFEKSDKYMDTLADIVASQAYGIADAMLKARDE